MTLAFALREAARAVRPVPPMLVSAWAAAERQISAESGSPYPGRWVNDRVPYAVEIMDCLSDEHPAREVTFKKSAQVAGTEIGINLFGYTVDRDPKPMLIVLPSVEEAQKYNRVKLQPTIDATPALRRKVLQVVSRDETGSTTMFKKFRGGFAVITGANSSKGLQMISAARRVYEEWSEYPDDVDGRGEPTAQAESRAKAWTARGGKAFYNSTPALAGSCRISAKYETTDQRRFYVPCPSCGSFQRLTFDRLKWSSDVEPYGAYFVCAAAGCVIEPPAKSAMLAAGVWIKCWPGTDADPAPPDSFPADELARWRARGSGRRQPGFHIWQAYSPFVPWDATVAEYLAAQGDPRKLKTFWQQALGEPFEEQGEAPDHERLFERRQPWPAKRLPAGVLFTTGVTDVQADRLEWAVYAWDRELAGYWIDGGVLAGDPNADDVWAAHDQLLAQRYQDAWGRAWPVDSWGVDAGYLSQRVYAYVRRHATEGRVRALDGRPGWKLPALGSPRTVDVDYQGRKIGSVQLWPVGTWDLKAELYGMLRRTIEGPDADGVWPRRCMWFPDRVDRGFFEQLTAEFLADRRSRSGYTVKEWQKIKGRRNEQHDLAVYALALAHHESDGLTDDEWQRLADQRLGSEDAAQLDLARLWSRRLAGDEPAAQPTAASAPPVAMAPTMTSPMVGGGGWITPRADWLRR